MHSITQSNELLFRRAFEQICSTVRAEILVDIGSGDGKYSRKLAKLTHAKTVICVDHDRDALKKAKKNGCQTILADLNEKIKLPPNSADVIIINQVIEHIAKTDNLVKEVHRILKPGGISIWCTPNLASWHNIVALILGYQPFSSQISDEAFLGNPLHPQNGDVIHEAQAHLRLFTPYSLKALLTFHRYNAVKTMGIGFYPFKSVIAKIGAILMPNHAAYVLLVARK